MAHWSSHVGWSIRPHWPIVHAHWSIHSDCSIGTHRRANHAIRSHHPRTHHGHHSWTTGSHHWATRTHHGLTHHSRTSWTHSWAHVSIARAHSRSRTHRTSWSHGRSHRPTRSHVWAHGTHPRTKWATHVGTYRHARTHSSRTHTRSSSAGSHLHAAGRAAAATSRRTRWRDIVKWVVGKHGVTATAAGPWATGSWSRPRSSSRAAARPHHWRPHVSRRHLRGVGRVLARPSLLLGVAAGLRTTGHAEVAHGCAGRSDCLRDELLSWRRRRTLSFVRMFGCWRTPSTRRDSTGACWARCSAQGG